MNLLTAPLDIGLALFQRAVLIPLRPLLTQIVREEASHYLTDIEWRYSQARDLLNEVSDEPLSMRRPRKLTAEDLDTKQHNLTGFTLTDNTDAAGAVAAGSIRWQALHIVYSGVDYVIVDGATLLKFTTFVFPSLTLVSSNTLPTLGKDDMLVFVNNSGTGVVAGSSGSGSLPVAVANNSVNNASLVDGSVSGAKVAALGIGSGKLATGAIDLAAQFGAGVVNNAALGALAVDGAKLAAGAVTAGKIGTGGVSAAAQIAAGMVDNTALGTNAVTDIKINAAGIGAGKLATGAVSASTMFAADVVTNAAIGPLAVTGTELNTGAVTAGKIATGGVSAAGQFAADVVDTAAIAPLAVSSGELAANSVIAGKVASGAINNSNVFTTGIVNTAAIGAGAVTPAGLNILSHILY